MKHTKSDLYQMQALSLESKKRMTYTRIRDWYEEFEGNVYFSYSGGKDSTALLEQVAKFCKEYGYRLFVRYCNTGLEYPEVREFAKTHVQRVAEKYGINIDYDELKPEMIFRDVILNYGYPIISKEVSKIVYGARHSKKKKQSYINKLDGLNPDFTYSEYKQQYKKYKILLYAPFEISNRCCYVMKEKPLITYERESGNKPIVATMAEESRQRLDGWLKTGCNAYDSDRPMSKPISFWTEQDILEFLYLNNIPMATVYGVIHEEGTAEGQMFLDGIHTKLTTSGCKRTGCIFCAYGAHCDKGLTRFQRLKQTHPKLYSYCIGGGEFNERGMWQPTKTGLGMGFVFDWLNENLRDDFIRYE